jgi:hypothetical protein
MSSFDPLDIRGQERVTEESRQRDRLAQVNEAEDFKWLMGSKRGRRVVWRHLDRAGVFRLSFNTNAMQMAFAEGNRNEGLRILNQIHTLCPELYPVMMKEQVNDNRHADDGRRNDH